MAKATVSEYADVARDDSGTPLPIGLEPALAVKEVDFSGGEAKSDTFQERTRFVMVCSDSDVRYQFDVAPTAVGSGKFARLPANGTFFHGVRRDSGLKVSIVGEV